MTIQPQEPAPLDFAIDIGTRDADLLQDGFIQNGYVENDKDTPQCVRKRPGCIFGQPPWPDSPGRGWSFSAWDYITIRGAGFYTGAGLVSAFAGATSAQMCNFAEYPGGIFMQAGSGVNFYTYNGTSLTSQTNGSLGSFGFNMGVWLLDGTMYMLSNNGNIYGSNINDPTVWPTTNAIAVNGFSSTNATVGLAKQKVYLIAFLRNSLSVFYDAGNPTGSPLAPVPGGYSSIGCNDSNTIQCIGDDMIWCGRNSGGLFAVWHMQDLKIEKISTDPVERIIAPYSTFFQLYTAQISVGGHRYYVLNVPNPNVSLVYDLDTKKWYVWLSTAGLRMDIQTSLSFATPPDPIAQLASSGDLMKYSPLTYQDLGVNFTMQLQTNNWTGGVNYKKTLMRIDFLTDQVPGATMTVTHSDDDYQTFSSPRTVDLSVVRPNLSNCGTFRKRAYRITQTGNFPFRMYPAVMSVLRGTL